jgi:hypothetical protein
VQENSVDDTLIEAQRGDAQCLLRRLAHGLGFAKELSQGPFDVGVLGLDSRNGITKPTEAQGFICLRRPILVLLLAVTLNLLTAISDLVETKSCRRPF